MAAGGAAGGRRRLLRARLGLLLAPIFGLAGCLIEREPATPVPPTATRTPRPTPTATPASLRVEPPPPTVVGQRAPVATTGTAVVRGPEPGLRGAGRLLYIGRPDGRLGIVAADADGGNRRLLVEGQYEGPVWSADGGRFAAYGTTNPAGPPDQLAIFTVTGRPVARFPFAGLIAAPPAPSPDGRTFLCLYHPTGADPRATPPLALLADDDGLREIGMGGPTIPWRWTPNGRVAVRLPASGGGGRGGELLSGAIWGLDPVSGVPRGANSIALPAGSSRPAPFIPVGWSRDEAVFYAIASPQALDPGNAGDLFAPLTLFAVDGRSGATRVVVSAADLAARLPRDRPSTAGVQWFAAGSVAPVSGTIALWLQHTAPPGTPDAGAGTNTIVVLIDGNGSPLAQERVRGTVAAIPFWSPDGARLAHVVLAINGYELHLLAPDPSTPLVYPLSPAWTPASPPPTWSPDGRWIAFDGRNGATIAAALPPQRAVLLANDGQAPAWWPVVRS